MPRSDRYFDVTNSPADVDTLNQGFVSNEIEDTYLSHLDLNGFCTIDNNLQGVAGDTRRINVYTASGSAIDVAEGQGNTDSISVDLTVKEYVIKCAQAWFRYSDEAYMRDPVAVQAGLAQLGVAMFNKVNADILAEMRNATLSQSTTNPDFNAFVDAVAKMDIKDAAGETAMDAQRRFIPTVWAIMSQKDVAATRKACGTALTYNPEHAWTPGYVGEVGGVTLYYKQDAVPGEVYVGTNKAITVFNKSGVQTEQAARSGGTSGTANLRFNDFYARKYYIAALTDTTQIVKMVVSSTSI